MRISNGVLVLSLTLGFAACKAELKSDLSIDGNSFEPKKCRSGQAFGFSGVEFKDNAGTRVRLLQTPTGGAVAVVFDPGAKTGTELGACGPLKLVTQNSTINNIKNVMGEATLDCTANARTLKGTIQFKNCH